MHKIYLSVLIASLAVGVSACSSKAGNVALGAGAAGAAYEYSNREQIQQLDKDLQEGRISQDEYNRRRAEIEKRSIAY